jgi:hypothetical protein
LPNQDRLDCAQIHLIRGSLDNYHRAAEKQAFRHGEAKGRVNGIPRSTLRLVVTFRFSRSGVAFVVPLDDT